MRSAGGRMPEEIVIGKYLHRHLPDGSGRFVIEADHPLSCVINSADPYILWLLLGNICAMIVGEQKFVFKGRLSI